MDTPRITSVMPTTSRRLWCLGRSIRCWHRQTWPERELLVLSDGPGEVEIRDTIMKEIGGHQGDPIRHHEALDAARIRHVHLRETPPTLGDKWNVGFELAGGPLLHFWGDDDWQSPVLLETVARALLGAGTRIAGSNTMLARRPRDASTWMYWSPPVRPHLVGGTIVFRKELWEKTRLPSAKSASDTAWQLLVYWPSDGTEEGEEYTMISDPRLYVAWIHDDNTGNALGTDPEAAEKREVWERITDFDVRKLIVEDRDLFGLDPEPVVPV